MARRVFNCCIRLPPSALIPSQPRLTSTNVNYTRTKGAWKKTTSQSRGHDQDPEIRVTRQDEAASGSQSPTPASQKKHYSFYLSIVMLAVIALIVSWDVTALSLALPVRPLLHMATALLSS